jgi:hypothetical protein
MTTLMRNGRDRRSENPSGPTRYLSACFWLGPISGSHQGQQPLRLHRNRGNPPSENRPYTWPHPNASQKSQICPCNAGTVHTWPVSTVRRDVAICLELRSKRTRKRRLHAVENDPKRHLSVKTATAIQAEQRVARCSQSARAAKPHDYSMRRSAVAEPAQDRLGNPHRQRLQSAKRSTSTK